MPLNSQKINEYLMELETKVAFQEQTIEELNQALVHQQFALDKLQNQVRQLAEKLKGIDSSNIASRAEETPPPHY
ncbi:SlyX protein [Pasteurellaceae bacterium 15-036681]|nr:SlyX protein [Pasteurellaceae bacterium 15-036681]